MRGIVFNVYYYRKVQNQNGLPNKIFHQVPSNLKISPIEEKIKVSVWFPKRIEYIEIINVKKKESVIRKVYRISQKSLGFLSNIKAQETNNLILNLTWILAIIGFGTFLDTFILILIALLK